MAGIMKKSGHAVTGVLPPHSDGVQVAPAAVQFPMAPAHQSGGMGGPNASSAVNAYNNGGAKKKQFPPATAK